MEGVRDCGGASHVGDDWLASEEARGGELRRADREGGFDAFFVEFRFYDLDITEAIGTVSDCSLLSGEIAKVDEICVVAIQNYVFRRSAEKG